ncbi:hypothetical protein LIA77_07612 [Sarocladium implicatum]|nr:hypothetical protein LIA77_07612 [Sarocladium implicatum]
MAESQRSTDADFFISNRLNVLQLSGLSQGGETVRATIETEHPTQEETKNPEKPRSIDLPSLIKLQEPEEDETSLLSLSQDDTIPQYVPVNMARTRSSTNGKAQFRAQLEDDDLMIIDEADVDQSRLQLQKDMEAERQRFTGASNWAPAEERLFELLYMREQLPMMPRHWQYDFQGVPFQDHVFSTSEENPPVIHAHTQKTEFQGTKGMMQLIDLSSKVRTLMQTGFEAKAPALIHRTLNDFVAWAAADGGYRSLEVVPNLIVEVVDSDADHVNIIKTRMDALAQLQRDFLRIDREDHGWEGVKTEVRDSGFLMAGSPPRSARSRAPRYVHRRSKSVDEMDEADHLFNRLEVSTATPKTRAALAAAASRSSDASQQAGQKRKRTRDDHAAAPGRRKKLRQSETPSDSGDSGDDAPRTPSISVSKYSRRPPVVWGLFIINTSAFLCTVDSAKEGPEAYVSWHVEIAFSQTRQCVWHALTVALVVCLARDELMTRLQDFETLPEEVDSDPDL